MVDVLPLISHRFRVERAAEAYEVLTGGGASLGILLEYSGASRGASTVSLGTGREVDLLERRTWGFYWDGELCGEGRCPRSSRRGRDCGRLFLAEGLSAAQAGRRFGFARASSDIDAVLTEFDIDTVFIATPHESHAELVLEALAAG